MQGQILAVLRSKNNLDPSFCGSAGKKLKTHREFTLHGQILAVLEGRGSKTITTTTPVLVARGGLERSNPATTTTHSGMGVKETHNFMLWEKTPAARLTPKQNIIYTNVLTIVFSINVLVLHKCSNEIFSINVLTTTFTYMF